MGVSKNHPKLFLQMERSYLTVDDERKVATCLSERLGMVFQLAPQRAAFVPKSA